MATEQLTEKATCSPQQHSRHLCHLIYQGFHNSHRQEYNALVIDGQYVCRKCGGSAQRPENLCFPYKL